MRSLFWISLFLVGVAGVIIPGMYMYTASGLPQLDSEFELEKLLRYTIEGERKSYVGGTFNDQKKDISWARPDFSKLPKDLVALYISQLGCPTFFQTPREEGFAWAKRLLMGTLLNQETGGDGRCERRMAMMLAFEAGVRGSMELNVAADKIHGYMQKDQLVAYTLTSFNFQRAVVGVDDAAQKLLKKRLDEMSLAEQAEFALTLPIPGLYLWDEVKECKNAGLIRQARDSLLVELSRDGLIPPDKAKSSMGEPIACLDVP